jgi:2-aminoethylphosphonate-pyruvate transaminase
MTGRERDPWLLTPGPLTTSASVKAAMTRDWGSRDAAFIAINRRVRERLVQLVGGDGTYVCVPLQGSGTFAVEAMIGTFLPRNGKLLILINGAYGKRAARICDYAGRTHTDIEWAEDQAVDPRRVEAVLKATLPSPMCSSSTAKPSGVLNPIQGIGVAAAGRRLLIDSMSAFGALPLDAREIPFDAVAASSNKCIEGVPGVGFVICRRDALEAAKGNAHSLSLDLHGVGARHSLRRAQYR